MAVKFSTGLRNAMLYSGALPATADAAVGGTLLCTISVSGSGLTFAAPADIEANINRAFYFTAQQGAEKAARDAGSYMAGEPHEGVALGLLTFCVLILRNGFTVTGESACASPDNFDAEIGRKIARANAVAKVWPLMGYQLKQELHEQS
jgi:hypothetical protein